jgi:hypothetical protein
LIRKNFAILLGIKRFTKRQNAKIARQKSNKKAKDEVSESFHQRGAYFERGNSGIRGGYANYAIPRESRIFRETQVARRCAGLFRRI